MNDECMEMTQDDIRKVITSCRKRLGKSKKYTGNGVPETAKKQTCCDTKGFGK